MGSKAASVPDGQPWRGSDEGHNSNVPRLTLRRLDELLDEALGQTFPASDPVSVGMVA
jgi:hypothetical protein